MSERVGVTFWLRGYGSNWGLWWPWRWEWMRPFEYWWRCQVGPVWWLVYRPYDGEEHDET